MRRVLGHGTFLRFYLLLGLALCVVFFIALGGRSFIEQVRREDYREQLAALPMSLMTQQLADVPMEEREVLLGEFSEQLGMQLALRSLSEAPLGYFERARIERGTVLVSEEPWQLRQRLPTSSSGEQWMLEATFGSWSERQWQGSMVLLGEWLAEMPAEDRLTALTRLRPGSWPLSLLNALPDDLTTEQQFQLTLGGVITRLVSDKLSITLLYQLPNDADDAEQWLQAGPISRGDTLPLNLHLPLLVALMVVLSLIVYLIMRSIESRMARLELAATRIASGRLETRVKVESGDFLGRLGMAFNGMANQVQSLLRGQQEMIRAVSHELRTPVARIRFAVQMVEDMTDQPAIQRQLQGIDADIAELDELVDEILTYARLGGETVNGAELEMALVECRAMAERVIDTLAPLHSGQQLTLVPGPDIELLAEPRYLQRALQNLVGNACRYGKSQVVIRLWDEPHLVRIDVEDDGPGIPFEARADIFKPFARLDDSRARSSGGYGLGLSIVQKIMAGHGGSVTVDSSPALGGARFTLLIPRRDSPV
ncbi:ATP-binding protein [Vreelandella aquamarina]|uniref:histidine kinase n=1 Tax=Vreelandella aquamarina TaxID=77097 RepID=A0A857GNL9_9GAMM|nr:ATP-binding protein [Halomonas meridiana]QHD50928.1 two-component sensor histidine kinase [Halomonas meridiana]|tara:strand:- start:68 stop:1687 length:1620 start_codon:yes stop_codon:yes gene_type:complete